MIELVHTQAQPAPPPSREAKARELARIMLRYDDVARYRAAFRRGAALQRKVARNRKPLVCWMPPRTLQLPRGAGPVARFFARIGL